MHFGGKFHDNYPLIWIFFPKKPIKNCRRDNAVDNAFFDSQGYYGDKGMYHLYQYNMKWVQFL